MLRKFFILFLTSAGLYLLLSPVLDLIEEKFWAEEMVVQPAIDTKAMQTQSNMNDGELTIVPPPYSDGDMIGYIKIHSLNIQMPLIEGRNQKYLNKGIGHIEHTAYPGENGMVGLVAFQENKPIHELYSINKGEIIEITDYKNHFKYKVYKKASISPEECTFSNISDEESVMLVTSSKDKENLFVIYANRIY